MFPYNKNNSGPSTEPWGISQETFKNCEYGFFQSLSFFVHPFRVLKPNQLTVGLQTDLSCLSG